MFRVYSHTNQSWRHLFGHGKYSSFSHLTWRIHIFLKKINQNMKRSWLIYDFCFGYLVWCLKWVKTHCNSRPPVKEKKNTCLHRHKKLSRSLFSSSSTTVTRGARSETTPSSSGRKGCGPSWARKDAKPRKLCLSVASAESVKGKNERAIKEHTAHTETVS